MSARKQYLEEVGKEYQRAGEKGRSRLLDEAEKRTGLNRKYLIRVLNHPHGPQPRKRRRRRAEYGAAVVTALVEVWDIFEQPCGQRMVAVLRSELDRLRKLGELRCSDPVEELNGHRSIWTVDVDGTNQKQLTMAGNSYDHSISGDGRTLAYVSDRGGSPAIWTMDIDGGNQEMKVKADAEAFPQLSPDGKWITYTTIGSRHWTTLWRVATRGGRPVELSDKLWQHPAISPDGKSIAGFYADQQLGTQRTPTSIAVIHSDGGPPWQVIPISLSVSTKPGIRWTPNGAQLIYVDGRKDGDNLWSQPLNGGRPRQLTRFHSDTLFSFDWSHDGKQLVFNRGVEARDVVLVQDAQRK